MELLEGTMMRAPNLTNISTKQQRIATLAEQMPNEALHSLSHHLDMEWMREAYRRTRKDGAVGVDAQTAQDYEKGLEENLKLLLDRAKAGTSYRAPPVRRVYIPKGDGTLRPLGIPTFEDKVLQRAITMLLEPLYEHDFLDCSYGFRPKRSAHQALARIQTELTMMGGGWVLDLDISKFFDCLSHDQLQQMLAKRIGDGIVKRLIGKWLKAGVMEDGVHTHSETGSPQGGVISPCLANVYLHEVLDTWFAHDVVPRLRGRAFLIRYADDCAIAFALESDARRVMAVLPRRLGKYGLALHPEKTRLIDFRHPPRKTDKDDKANSFDMLGLTHHWAKSKRGYWVVKQKTAKGRFTRAIQRIRDWCRENRHRPVREQSEALAKKLRGHYAYYGVIGNSQSLGRFYYEVCQQWRKWLSRRSQKALLNWQTFNKLLKRFPLPVPRMATRLVVNP
jgi:RNA-directed DNA polymerase